MSAPYNEVHCPKEKMLAWLNREKTPCSVESNGVTFSKDQSHIEQDIGDYDTNASKQPRMNVYI